MLAEHKAEIQLLPQQGEIVILPIGLVINQVIVRHLESVLLKTLIVLRNILEFELHFSGMGAQFLDKIFRLIRFDKGGL